MLKPAILAFAGIAVFASAASAEMLLPVLPRPDLSAIPAPLNAPQNAPAVELCERFGIACTLPNAVPDAGAGDIAALIPLAEADAAKRWALYAEQWAEIAEIYEDYAPVDMPAPRLPHIAQGYGWQHGQIADITALMDDVQERLDRGPAPLRSFPFAYVAPRHSLGGRFYGGPTFNGPAFSGLPGHILRNTPGTIVRPQHLPGNSVVILPRR